jgi:phosphoribosylglycinamide formyltransferase-1
MKKLCVFASGAGSNAENLIRYFQKNKTAEVTLIVTNRADAGVNEVARKLGVEVFYCNRDYFSNPAGLTSLLTQKGIDLVILAGFLWLLPACLIQAYPNKIINIHPSLLPKYGGKGMFGEHVHKAVIAAGEKESGITIHYVNERYDQGSILLQARCPVEPGETLLSLSRKVLMLEHRFFPPLVESLVV